MVKDKDKVKAPKTSRATFADRYLVSALVQDEKTLAELNSVIEKAGGKLVKSESQGKKVLQFPINKHRELTLISVFFEIEAEKIKELDQTLRHEDSIERYLLTKWEAEVPIIREHDHDREHRSRARVERN